MNLLINYVQLLVYNQYLISMTVNVRKEKKHGASRDEREKCKGEEKQGPFNQVTTRQIGNIRLQTSPQPAPPKPQTFPLNLISVLTRRGS